MPYDYNRKLTWQDWDAAYMLRKSRREAMRPRKRPGSGGARQSLPAYNIKLSLAAEPMPASRRRRFWAGGGLLGLGIIDASLYKLGVAPLALLLPGMGAATAGGLYAMRQIWTATEPSNQPARQVDPASAAEGSLARSWMCRPHACDRQIPPYATYVVHVQEGAELRVQLLKCTHVVDAFMTCQVIDQRSFAPDTPVAEISELAASWAERAAESERITREQHEESLLRAQLVEAERREREIEIAGTAAALRAVTQRSM